MAWIQGHSLLAQTFILIFCLFMTVSASFITLYPEEREIAAQIGEPLQITAVVTDCDEPSFIWSSLMDRTLSGTVSTKGHVSNLTMAEVTMESEGYYVCKVFCTQGKAERDVRITTYSFSSDPILKPSTSEAGIESTITCTVPHVYPAERIDIKILMDKRVVSSNNWQPTSTDMNQIQNVSVSYSLILTEDNEGSEIECVAQFELDDMTPKIRTTNMTLFLFYPAIDPHITVHPSTNVKLMETITLSCQAKSNSPVSFRWCKVKGDQIFDLESEGDGKLTIQNAKVEDAGQYICFAQNGGNTTPTLVNITVQNIPDAPRIDINPNTSVILGQPFTIECYGSRDNSTNMTLWSLSESENKLLMDKEGILEIHAADVQDGVTYVCRAENPVGRAEARKQVIVQYPPRSTVLSYLPTNPKEGDTVILTCKSDAVPAPSFSISAITNTGESMLLKEGSEIIFENIDSFSDLIECYAFNSLGGQTATTFLSVQVPPKYTKLEILPSSLVREGDSIVLWCTSMASPAPHVTLKKKTDNGLQELEMIEWKYHIEAVEVEQEGTYICESQNAIGFESSETTLTVQVPPKNTELIILPSTSVREGESVHILCKSTARPPPEITLKKKTDTGLLDLEMNDGEYHIVDVQVEHTGTYVCVSRNDVGVETTESILNIQVPPKQTYLTITPSTSVKEGESVHIMCVSMASPPPEVTLRKKDDTDFTVVGEELYIDSVSVEQAGIYICESRNIVGYESTETTLSVQAPPENTTVVIKPSENVTEGDTVTITCETNSSPSPTMLLKKECAGNNVILESQNGTVTLPNVTLNDTGIYTLSIIDKEGNKTKVIEINVQERQRSPKYSYILPSILLSLATVSTGVIGVIIYRLKQAKLKGSYSLVEALKSRV
uniref:Ig-like domain-containing protein n=1 Tax=Leptobrachium leishanense TaxID=445787 RepID=A0A8C5QCV5_9ANUR